MSQDMITRRIGNSDVPALGLGTYLLTGSGCVDSVESALSIGYRHIDTAQMYGNEAEVAKGIRQSGISREELFITTKIWRSELTPARMEISVQHSLQKLKMDYVDLLLIHWPEPGMDLHACLDTLSQLKDRQMARHVGVSNFSRLLLSAAITSHPGLIVNHQFECHPFLTQHANLAFCRNAGIIATAYSPLAQGRVRDNATLTKIAARHHKTASQVALRWLLQQEGVIAIPKASKLQNLQANIAIMDFELSDAEMQRIGSLNSNSRFVNPGWAPRWEAEA